MCSGGRVWVWVVPPLLSASSRTSFPIAPFDGERDFEHEDRLAVAVSQFRRTVYMSVLFRHVVFQMHPLDFYPHFRFFLFSGTNNTFNTHLMYIYTLRYPTMLGGIFLRC